MALKNKRRAILPLFDILREKAAVEIITDCVVHKSLLCLWLGPCLPFEDHVVVPSVDIKRHAKVEHSSQFLCLWLTFQYVLRTLNLCVHENIVSHTTDVLTFA